MHAGGGAAERATWVFVTSCDGACCFRAATAGVIWLWGGCVTPDRVLLLCMALLRGRRYQPRHNIMVSTEFGTPLEFFKGFDPAVAGTEYGRWVGACQQLGARVALGAGPMGRVDVLCAVALDSVPCVPSVTACSCVGGF